MGAPDTQQFAAFGPDPMPGARPCSAYHSVDQGQHQAREGKEPQALDACRWGHVSSVCGALPTQQVHERDRWTVAALTVHVAGSYGTRHASRPSNHGSARLPGNGLPMSGTP